MAGNKKPQKKYVVPDQDEVVKIPPHLLKPLKASEHLKLKTMPHQALVEFRKGTATKKDWYTVTSRILATLNIARISYEAVTVQPLEQGYVLCQAILERHNASGDVNVKATPEELVDLVACVDAADEIQHQVARFLQLKCYKKAFEEMKKYK